MNLKRLRSLGTMLLGGIALFIAVGGLLHTPVGRPLLARLGGCPVGVVKPQDAERLHRAANAQSAGLENAQAKPCPGFALGQAERLDVSNWAKRWNLTCRDKLEGHLMLCAHVPAEALSRAGHAIEEVEFSFGVEDGKLYALSLFSRKDPQGAEITDLVAGLERTLGIPHVRLGSMVGTATFTQAYHFANYTNELTATPIGESVAVREHYALLAPSDVPRL
jgi:hypothetical protein